MIYKVLSGKEKMQENFRCYKSSFTGAVAWNSTVSEIQQQGIANLRQKKAEVFGQSATGQGRSCRGMRQSNKVQNSAR